MALDRHTFKEHAKALSFETHGKTATSRRLRYHARSVDGDNYV
jgi:hypothetical protein